MKDIDGRWLNRIWWAGASTRPAHSPGGVIEGPPSGATTATLASAHAVPRESADALRARIGSASFAFRGYDVSNLGRSAELLAHPAYGATVRGFLDRASALCSDAAHRPIDLAAYIEAGAPSTLNEFLKDVGVIVAMELAQLALLEEFFGVPVREASHSIGYSIGELAALVLGGVFTLEQVLPVPLGLAQDCAELAADSSLGILFTRAPVLPKEDVEKLCVAIRNEGRGLIGPSAYLSPNTALILGQGETLSRLEAEMGRFLPGKVMLRRNPNHWPPLHSPLVWQRNIPNRAAVALYQIEGGTNKPSPRILSCVTGGASYDGQNNRELLIKWTDHPQLLWDAIDGTLSAGVETVIHVGPAPNLIPATFTRLSNNVSKYLGNEYWKRLGRGVVNNMNRHAWLSYLLPSRAALLRAPYLEQIILEDWLLAQKLP